jgi:hypothetical protein
MILIEVPKEKENNIQEVLNYIEKKVRLYTIVKINKELYKRIRPFNNKLYKCPDKFMKLKNDIEKANVTTYDSDGDKTLTIPDYKVIFI